jgi:hypothetical protein
VASVTVPEGWSEASESTSTDLILVGPGGIVLEWAGGEEPASETLAEVLQAQLARVQQSAPDAQVCYQPVAHAVPGDPTVPGEAEVLCYTVTPQNGAATPYTQAIYDGLVQVSGGQLLIDAHAYAPQTTSTGVIQGTVLPILDSAHWLPLSTG